MQDPRFEKLAQIMLGHSIQLQKGHSFVISSDVAAIPLVKALLKKAKEVGALAVVKLTDQEVNRHLLDLYELDDDGVSESFLQTRAALGIQEFEKMHGEVIIRSYQNAKELAGIDPQIQQLVAKHSRPFRDFVINQRKWVLFEYPTPGQAQLAGIPYEQFFDHAFAAATIDYEQMREYCRPLEELMQQTKEVHILGLGTDLSFKIEGIPVIPCCGEANLPDGECFTAPHKNSVEGHITFNTPSLYWGTQFDQVYLEFKQGQIVKAEAGKNTAKLNQILDTDEGARYIGEFSLGFHPLISQPFCNTLFDEKIKGSFHFTPGSCYEEADNGNKSAIHWDLVQIQRPDYGGGEIFFDDKLVRKDGLFVLPELEALNY